MIEDPTKPKPERIVVLRMTGRRKTAYVRAARGQKLTAALLAVLDRWAGYRPDEDEE